MHISIFLSRIKDIYAIQTSGIKDLKELIKTYNPKEIDLIQNIEEHNPDDNNLTQDIDLTENTKEWMKLFKRCLEVLNDVKTRKDTYSDGYNTDNTDNTDTESLIDNEDNKDNENKLKK
jgi:DNA-binding PadR family transcriptional regulator